MRRAARQPSPNCHGHNMRCAWHRGQSPKHDVREAARQIAYDARHQPCARAGQRQWSDHGLRGDSGACGCMVIVPMGLSKHKNDEHGFKAKRKQLITLPKVRPLKLVDSSCYPVPNEILVMINEQLRREVNERQVKLITKMSVRAQRTKDMSSTRSSEVWSIFRGQRDT